MATSRRTFLKFLSVSPAIFQALPAFSQSRFKKKIPKDTKGTQKNSNEPLSNPRGTGSVIMTYPGKPTGTGGTISYNAEKNMTTHTFTRSGTYHG
jgi:hypothetical protein